MRAWRALAVEMEVGGGGRGGNCVIDCAETVFGN